MTTELVELAERPEFTVDEALRIADQNADSYEKVASVSRTLAAEVRRLRALASRAGGWRTIDSAPTKQRVLVCGGDTPNGTAIATCDPGRYTPWHESHDELPMVRSWYADTMSGRSIWPHPTHWQPLAAAHEPVAVGSNNLSSDEEESP